MNPLELRGGEPLRLSEHLAVLLDLDGHITGIVHRGETVDASIMSRADWTLLAKAAVRRLHHLHENASRPTKIGRRPA